MSDFARLGMAVALAVFVSTPSANAACSDDRVELRGDFGTVRFRVAVADDPRERSQGLMHVPEMPRMSGMLFVYERPQSVSFWMANTLIPLDMIFADETGVVTRIHENAVPLDRTPIPGGDGVQFVLEINGGMARQLGIDEGDELRHPSVSGDLAVWPCDAE
ncbi:DUF192 domain-containing protein [Maritalea mobilis]|uniref:DUF192 domain-containing protein n=1 Tax=Maritalea mobilis TaxID=483324 RepID=UPI001C94920C|nr:DUF192 domain-containing protein [Maritalea mobilis]MBY6200085.1 DUF192 domain-containing protein [Maritalea mobilis]